jgi:hypothetical protein
MFARSSGEGPYASLFRTWTACFFVLQSLAGIATGGTAGTPAVRILEFEAQPKQTARAAITSRCVAWVVLDAIGRVNTRLNTGLRAPRR